MHDDLPNIRIAGRRAERFDTTLAIRLERGSGVARNISENGIYFVSGVPLEQGAPVKFSLQFANYPGGPIQVIGIARIVRVEEQGEKKGFGAAINSLEFVMLTKPEVRPSSQ